MTALFTPEFVRACKSPLWDESFWVSLTAAQNEAAEALAMMWEEAKTDPDGCACDTCVVRTVLQAVFPTLTDEVARISALQQPVQTMRGGCASGTCRCRKE